MQNLQKISRCLISVSDKSGVVELAKYLAYQGVEIISTGGTFKLLEKENYMVMPMAGNNAYCIYFSPMNKLYIIIREFLPTNTSEFIEVNTFGLDVYIQKSSLSRIYQTIIPPLKLTTTKTSRNHEYGIDRCYIINTKSRTDRLAHTVNELDKHNLFGITVEGVEGTTIDFDKLIGNGIYKPDSRMGMCANQIACFMSHLKAIKEIAKLPDHVKCLIVEDDVVFLNEFDKYGRLLNQDLIGMDTYWDIIMFGSRRQNIKDPFTKTTIPYLYETGLVLGTWAYMLNGRSARHIISKIYPFSLPLDVTITIQSKHTPSSYTFDDRFLDNLKKFVIHTGNTFDNERFGIINELSSFVWIDSTSSPT